MNYISAARVHSRDVGFDEPMRMSQVMKRVAARMTRGVGQAKQTQSFPLRRFGELPVGDKPWAEQGPVGPADSLIINSWWLMREIEVAATNRCDVTIHHDRKEVEIRLTKTCPSRTALTTQR